MNDKVTVVGLAAEGFKRIKAVAIKFGPGLNVIAGKNRQGKTSVIEAIAAAVGGNKLCPHDPVNDGAKRATVDLDLSNGLKVKRVWTGKSDRLEIEGGASTQATLDAFLSVFALDIRKILNASMSELYVLITRAIGFDVTAIEKDRKVAYEKRRDANRDLDSERKRLGGMRKHDDVIAPVDVASLKNAIEHAEKMVAEHAKLVRAAELEFAEIKNIEESIRFKEDEIRRDKKRLEQSTEKYQKYLNLAKNAKTPDVKAMQESLVNAAATNAKVEDNTRYDEQVQLVSTIEENVIHWEKELKKCDDEIKSAIDFASMPIEGLAITEDKKVTYNGKIWDSCSTSERIMVATAIASQQNPKMGFVLIDGLEALDDSTQNELNSWLVKNDLQAITTCVGSGEGKALVVIEDGQAKTEEEEFV